MKLILLIPCFAMLFSAAIVAAHRPIAEILEYGIYSGGHENSVVAPSAPTGRLLLGGPVTLEKQTSVVPARLKTKFGFRFVVHGKSDDAPVPVRFVYLFPEINDKASGAKIRRFEISAFAKPEDKSSKMLWDFTEPYELAPGEWIFQVFRGEDKILEKTFQVTRSGAK